MVMDFLGMQLTEEIFMLKPIHVIFKATYFWKVFRNNHHGYILSNSSNKLNQIRMSSFQHKGQLILETISVDVQKQEKSCKL